MAGRTVGHYQVVFFDDQDETVRTNLTAGVRNGDLIANYDKSGRTVIADKLKTPVDFIVEYLFGERRLSIQDYAPNVHFESQDKAA
jgi:hypothetical protein